MEEESNNESSDDFEDDEDESDDQSPDPVPVKKKPKSNRKTRTEQDRVASDSKQTKVYHLKAGQDFSSIYNGEER